MSILFEYILVFIFVYVMNYFMIIKKNKKHKKNRIPPELSYLKKIYNINIKKINYKKFVYTYSIINTFIITTIYIIIVYLIESWIFKIIIGIVLLILMTIICYGILGRYYLWKEGKKDV